MVSLNENNVREDRHNNVHSKLGQASYERMMINETNKIASIKVSPRSIDFPHHRIFYSNESQH